MTNIDARLHDLQYGVRMLSGNAGSTVVTVLALALVLWSTPPSSPATRRWSPGPSTLALPAEMVNLALIRDSGAANYTFNYRDYEAYRDSVHAFSDLIAFRPARDPMVALRHE